MYKMKIRTNYLRFAEAPRKSKLPYEYEPELDLDIAEGRLLMIVALYAHMDQRGYVRASMQNIFEYLGMNCSATHWKETVNTRVMNAGYQWLVENDLILSLDETKSSLTDYALTEVMCIKINSSLFDLSLDNKDFEPYFQLYQGNLETIFALHDSSIRKLLRVFCYVKSSLPNNAPFAWCVPVAKIVEQTGYTSVYISKALRILSDDLGVLHRMPLNRTSEMQPPYVYISDFTGWEKHLKQKVDEENERRGGVPVKAKPEPKSDPAPTPPSNPEPERRIYVEPEATCTAEGAAEDILKQKIENHADLKIVSDYVRGSGLLALLSTDEQRAINTEVIKDVKSFAKQLGLVNTPLDFADNARIQDIIKGRRILKIDG